MVGMTLSGKAGQGVRGEIVLALTRTQIVAAAASQQREREI